MSLKSVPVAVLLASPDEVEAAFYEAMREGDLDKLMAVWAEDEEVLCVHAGSPRLVGLAAVRASFEAIFASGRVGVQLGSVRRIVTLSTAVHGVMEHVRIHTEQGMRSGWVMATNVYLKTALGWRMVAHHASPGHAEPVMELADIPSVLH
jgi:ketosteroid isomerase-like protein